MPRKIIFVYITIVTLQFDEFFSKPEFINCLTYKISKSSMLLYFILTFSFGLWMSIDSIEKVSNISVDGNTDLIKDLQMGQKGEKCNKTSQKEF